jgi:hypothetical protein
MGYLEIPQLFPGCVSAYQQGHWCRKQFKQELVEPWKMHRTYNDQHVLGYSWEPRSDLLFVTRDTCLWRAQWWRTKFSHLNDYRKP